MCLDPQRHSKDQDPISYRSTCLLWIESSFLSCKIRLLSILFVQLPKSDHAHKLVFAALAVLTGSVAMRSRSDSSVACYTQCWV